MNMSKTKYKVVKVFIEDWILSHPDKDPFKEISELSLATYCPIVIVCYFIGEIRGFTPEIKETLQRLKDFYQIEEIVE